MAATAYRLLCAVLMTAAEDDQLISANPCRIRGAGDKHPEERPVLTVAQVFELADRVGRRPVGDVRKVRNADLGGAGRVTVSPRDSRLSPTVRARNGHAASNGVGLEVDD
ncbi:hypothetical protein ACQP25_06150 [Microtetraspora malaysiensis]|uniref:hypothetical protein n=1 Tax=Microtetraspora malaysiensis TaxID=161358 RepID=UPI003D94A844